MDARAELLIRYGGDFVDGVVARASGSFVETVDGQRVLDFTAGQICATVGHNHPRVVAAVEAACRDVLHLNSWMLSEPVLSLAERLVGTLPDPLRRVMLLSTGGEGIEAALRMAKLSSGRFEVAALTRSWHGVTAGASAVTYAAGRSGYGPAAPGTFALPAPYAYRCPIRHCDGACDCTCLEAGFDLFDQASVGSPAAVVAEPVLSAGGVIVPPPGYFLRLAELARERGMLLVLDECQTGLGRLGAMYGFEVYGVVPDLLVLSKTLGGGVPVSAVVTSAAIEAACHERGFVHVTSHVSDPMPAAAALAVIDVVQEEGLAGRARSRGEYLLARLGELQERHEHIGDVRGLGLLCGLELVEDRGTRAAGGRPRHRPDRRVPALRALDQPRAGRHRRSGQLPADGAAADRGRGRDRPRGDDHGRGPADGHRPPRRGRRALSAPSAASRTDATGAPGSSSAPSSRSPARSPSLAASRAVVHRARRRAERRPDVPDALAAGLQHGLGLQQRRVGAHPHASGEPAGGVVDPGEARHRRRPVQQRVRGQVGDRELGLQAVGDAGPQRGRVQAHRVHRHDELARRVDAGLARDRAGLDGAVGLQAARVGLDPVLLRGARAAAVLARVDPARAVGRLEAAVAALDRLADQRPGRREPRRRGAGGGRAADLQRLAVGAERRPQPARLQQCRPQRVRGALLVEPEQPRGGQRRARDAADGRRVPAGGAQARVVGGGEATRELEAGRERGQRLAGAHAQLGAEHQRDGRHRGGEVREAGQVGVVVVEHVAGGAGRGDPVAEPVAERARRPRRARLSPRRPRTPASPAAPCGGRPAAAARGLAARGGLGAGRAHAPRVGRGVDSPPMALELLVLVKHDCETCATLAPALDAAAAGGAPVRMLSQSDGEQTAARARRLGLGTVPELDEELETSGRFDPDAVPAVLLLDGGAERDRVEGLQRDRLDELFAAAGATLPHDGLPEFRPGCASRTRDPDVAARLAAARARAEGRIRSRELRLGALEDPLEALHDRGLTDGLPVVPPTPERVVAMLAHTARDPRELVGVVPPYDGEATVEKVAVNAVMAGCAGPEPADRARGGARRPAGRSSRCTG